MPDGSTEDIKFDLPAPEILRETQDKALAWACLQDLSPDCQDRLLAQTALPPTDAPLPEQYQACAGQLLQVMMNLIQNAADACAAQPQGRLEIVLEAVPGPGWQLRFDDNGPGIPAALRRQVFDPFFTTKPVGQGTGLGLSISHGIMERHGGRLSVAESTAGGARFVIELPAAESCPASGPV